MKTRNLFIVAAVLMLFVAVLAVKEGISYVFVGEGLCMWLAMPTAFICACMFGLCVAEAINAHYAAPVVVITNPLAQYEFDGTGHFRSEYQARMYMESRK